MQVQPSLGCGARWHPQGGQLTLGGPGPRPHKCVGVLGWFTKTRIVEGVTGVGRGSHGTLFRGATTGVMTVVLQKWRMFR